MARAALAEGAQILVYPELFLTGFCYEPSPAAAEDPTYLRARSISRTGRGARVPDHRLASQRPPEPGLLPGLRRAWSCAPRFIPLERKKSTSMAETSSRPWPRRWGRVGLQICYDLRFPEVARSLALQGADFLVTVAQFPAARRAQWRTLCYCPGHRESDSSSGLQLGECRRLSDHQCPRRRCMAEAGAGETIILGDIDLVERDNVRREIPCFADRRPEIY